MKTEKLNAAMMRPADYSECFTKKIAEIQQLIQNKLGFNSLHDKDMNYSYSQVLSFFFDEKFVNTSHLDPRATFQVKVFFSSRDCIFCFVTFINKTSDTNKLGEFRPYWTLIGDQKPAQLEGFKNTIEANLKILGWENLPLIETERVVEGYLTEIDGEQATVFDVIFGEFI